MSKVSHLPKTFPAKDLAFTIKVKGTASKFEYTGNFMVRVPTTRESGRIGLELSKLNDGIPFEMLDRSTANLHNAIAFLKVCLVTGPAWFMNTPDDPNEEGIDFGLDTMDTNVPIEIFKKANGLVTEWHKSLRGQPNDESAETQS